MQFKKTFAVPLSLVVAAMLCSLSLPPEEKAKNLKVLPKNISHDELIKTMRQYNRALGVKCDYCHAKSANDPKKMDFASDDKEEKETARDMMRLTGRINKKYFKSGKDAEGRQIMTVTCYTCHHGETEPERQAKGGPENAPPAEAPHNN